MFQMFDEGKHVFHMMMSVKNIRYMLLKFAIYMTRLYLRLSEKLQINKQDILSKQVRFYVNMHVNRHVFITVR